MAEELSTLAQSVKLGFYRHFKGGEYEVLGVGRLSEDNNKEMVIYKSIKTGYTWLRPLEMFLENVERDSYKGPRFTFIKEN